ncbi:MAG: hypothetical protein NTX50_31550 [Candidatus Sumerlaeota bacterium]|nr:hypothetical protein [Candidatus Sumerlaeota bacterium]
MTRRERLMRTIRGDAVDRPPVSFYEIDGAQDAADPDPFNIYSDPTWKPLIELAREKSDRIVMCKSRVGEGGIVMMDTPDPLCIVADLFDMGGYTLMAVMRPDLFHRALEHCARCIQQRVEIFARALPGRLWRIYGPEYASPPYLPPVLFREYVTRYDKPIIEAIHRTGGFARIHCHGRLREILDDIAAMGAAGLDPIEPPPQGDVSLRYVRETYGRQMALFGNLEARDIENLPTEEFERKILQAIAEGTAGEGRGFCLMPSACPYGRRLPPLAMKNYEKMIEIIERI